MIEVSIDRATVAAGEFVTGSIHWKGEAGKVCNRIVAAAQWITDGEGNIAWGVGRSTQFALPANQREGKLPFRLLIPYEGPISFEGELITLEWKVIVRLDQSGVDELGEAGFRVQTR